MVRLLGVVALWAFVVVMALAGGWSVMYNLSYLILLLVLVSFLWTQANVRWVDFRRKPHGLRSQVGARFDERLEIENTSVVPKPWIEIQDDSEFASHSLSEVLALGPLERRIWTIRTLCRQRGKFQLGPVRVISGDPVGLCRAEREVAGQSTLIVYPATVDLPAFGRLPGDLPGGSLQGDRVQFTTPNVATVREYQPGDAFNRIHWPSTARQQRLMVKEFELDPFADLWLVLDLDREVQVGSGPESTEEYAVTVCASLAKHFLMQHRAVGIITQGQVLPADRDTRQLLKTLELLAVVRAQRAVPLEQVIALEELRFRRQNMVVVITPSTDEKWVTSCRNLLARGIYVSAVVLEGSTFGRAPSSLLLVSTLAAAGLPTYLVKRGDRLDVALAQPVAFGAGPAAGSLRVGSSPGLPGAGRSGAARER